MLICQLKPRSLSIPLGKLPVGAESLFFGDGFGVRQVIDPTGEGGDLT